MATDLTSVAIKDGFSQLLHCDGGLASTETAVLDGDGTSSTLSLGTGSATIAGNLVISGNLTVSGTTTEINTQTLNVADNIVVLNNDVTGTPSQNAGIEVERGTSTNTLLRWNESSDRWQFTNDGSTYYNIPLSTEYNNYTLPTASSSVLGGIKVGTNLSIDGNGVLSASGSFTSFTIADTDSTQAIGDGVHIKFAASNSGAYGNSQISGSGTSGSPYLITLYAPDTDTNTFRTVTAGGNTLGASETLAFTEGSNITITESGGAVTIAATDTNTTYSVMGSGNSYAAGLVLAGSATHGGNFLRKDGTWATPSGSMDNFIIADTDSTQSITDGIYIKFAASNSGAYGNSQISGSGTSGSPYLVTLYAPDTDTDRYVNSASFNTSDGVLTLTRAGSDSATVTVDLDGRYLSTLTGSRIDSLLDVAALHTGSGTGYGNISDGQVLVWNSTANYFEPGSSSYSWNLRDGDATTKNITSGKFIQFVEGTGIDIDFINTSNTGAADSAHEIQFTNTLMTSGGTINGNVTISGNDRTLRLGGTSSETQGTLVLGGSNSAGSRVALVANSDSSYLDAYGGEGSTERYRDFLYAARSHTFRTSSGSSLGTVLTMDSSQNSTFSGKLKIAGAGAATSWHNISVDTGGMLGQYNNSTGIGVYCASNHNEIFYYNYGAGAYASGKVTFSSLDFRYNNSTSLLNLTSSVSIFGNTIRTSTNTDYAQFLGKQGGLEVRSSRSSDAGIAMSNSSGSFRFQLYGDGTNYGFLDGFWGNWDIKKVVNGDLVLRKGGSNYTVYDTANLPSYHSISPQLSGQTFSDYNTGGDGRGFTVAYANSSSSNKPTGYDHASLTMAYNNDWQVQMAGDWRTNLWYVRNQNSGSWGSWRELINSGGGTMNATLNWNTTSFPHITTTGSHGLWLSSNGGDVYLYDGSKAHQFYIYNGGTSKVFLSSNSGSYFRGGTLETNSVWMNDGTNYNAYNEGIRVFPPSGNGVSVIAMNTGSDTSTTSTPRGSLLAYSSYLELRSGNNSSIYLYDTSISMLRDTNFSGYIYIANQIRGGFGALTTGGTSDWNHSTNARSGAGYTLLLGNASNGPSGTGDYFHPHSYEYNSKNGNGNMTQFAIPYLVTVGGGMYMRHRYSGSWSGWVQFHDNNNMTGVARTGNTYGSFNITVGNNAWAGHTYSTHSSKPTIMFKDNHGDGGLYHQGSSSWRWYYSQPDTCLGINGSATSSSYGAYVTGAIYSTGDVVAFSDARVKTNVVTIDNPLDKVLNMRGVYYNPIDKQTKEVDDRRRVGVIAQELNEVLPEAVTYAEDVDEYGVDYGKLTGVLIEAIKELKQEINELKGS